MGSEPKENPDSFWLAYQEAHRHGGARAIHLVGAAAALGCVAAALLGRRRWLWPVAPAVAWASAALACLVSPHPELAWTPPGRLLAASARLLRRSILDLARPWAATPSPAAPAAASSNGKGRWAADRPPHPQEPADPSTLN
jgi:hypothetical protein